MRRLVAVVLVLAGVVAWFAWPAPPWVPEPMPELEMRCFTEPSYSFCINRVPGSTNPDLVVHFHGRNGAATWWNDATYYTGSVVRRWGELKLDAPTVVGVSFGPVWLMTGDAATVFAETILPRIERELGQPVARRMVVGESMGGVNALVVGLTTGARFSKVASLCAPMPTVAPYAAVGELVSYVRHSQTSLRRAGTMLMLSRKFYANDSEWRANFPLPLSSSADVASGAAFYVSCGKTDEWGCTEGSEQLVSNLRAHGATVQWVPTPGGHCDVDVDSLAKFLID